MAEILISKTTISLIYSRTTKISPISLSKNGKISPGKKNTWEIFGNFGFPVRVKF